MFSIPERRRFLQQGALGLVGASLRTPRLPADSPPRPVRVAAVYTEFRYRSHAHNILENFLEPPLFNGKWTDPGVKLVSFYADQFPEKDMTRSVAREYGIPIFRTIAETLTVGGKELAVDAVLLIGEHGDYPVNAQGVKEYPRKRFFDEIVAVFRRSRRSVPVFNDKHLSYRWDWAKEMYDTAKELKFPLMAGSSVPLAERRPSLELPPGSRFIDAVSIHGGPFEIYDFHGLEVLQSFVEARRGGETGVRKVQFLEGEALWKAADAGLWSEATANAAMTAELGPGQPTLRRLVRTAPFDKVPPWGVLVTFRDGLRGIVLKIGESTIRWNFACRLEGEKQPRATSFYVGPWGNRNLFMALSHAIQTFFRQRQAPYPAERTLLATGVLASAVESRVQKGKEIDTPHLPISYPARDFSAVREKGTSWQMLTEKTPQPMGIKKRF